MSITQDEDKTMEIFALDCSLTRFHKMRINPQRENTPFSEYGLSPVESSTLIVLHDTQAITMSRLAYYCGFTPSKTTRALDALVKKGLAKRTIPEENRRQVYVSTTETGYELVERNNREVYENFFNMMSAFSEKQHMIECYTYLLEKYSEHCGHPISTNDITRD